METFYNPDDPNVNIFKNPRISKAEKKALILKVLKEDKKKFYQHREYLHHNYYYYVIRLFTDAGDEDSFRDITREVCKDVKNDPILYDKYDNKLDIFGNTFLSNQIVNESPFNVLAQMGKFEFIDIMLDILKEYNLNDRMDVNTSDNWGKTIVDYAIENNKLSDVRLLADKFKDDFHFDILKKGKSGKNIEEVMTNRFSPLFQAMKDDNFEEYEIIFNKMLNGEEEKLPFDDRIDALGFSFVHNLSLVKDYLYLDLIFHEWESNSDRVKEVFFIDDLNKHMNTYHSVSGYTPITSILANGSKDMVDYILTKIFIDRAIKLDVSHLDGRGRGVLHLI